MIIKTWIERCNLFGLSFHSSVIILVLNLIGTIMEASGIAIFLPIFQFISANGNLTALALESQLWAQIIRLSDQLGITINLALLLSLAFVLLLTRQIVLYVRIRYYFHVMESRVKLVRDKLFRLYLESDTTYQDNLPIGNLVNVLTTEAREAIVALLTPILLISTGLVVTVYLSILSSLSLVMTTVATIVIGTAVLTTKRWLSQSAVSGRNLTDANSCTATFLVSRLKSPRLVRLSRTEEAEIKELGLLTTRQCAEGVRLGQAQARADLAIEPNVIAMSCIFLYTAITVFEMSIGEIGLYLLVAVRLLPVARELVRQWQGIQRGLGPIEIVERRINQMAAFRETNVGTYKCTGINDKLEFKNVFFKYPGNEKYVLNDISITVSAGTIVALVGPSGSGKSTLVDLLPRLRIVTLGEIVLDGRQLNKYDLASLRSQISYAPQSPQIFFGTISDHIKYGNLSATDDDVKEAAVLAGAHDFILGLPDGYNTLVGDGAQELSGGQKQRLDMARVLLSRAAILIMDEPTSNLDADSELIFRDSLKRIRDIGRITVIVVAHSLNNISNVDKIIVLRDGKIEGVGMHNELMVQGGWYQNAYKSQHA